MDKTKYNDFTLLIIYFLFAFCWAAKNLLPVSDVIVCGACGVVLGTGVILCQKMNLHASSDDSILSHRYIRTDIIRTGIL